MSNDMSYIPIEGRELSQLQFLYSLYRVLKDDDSLKPRLSSVGMWWRYKGILKQLHNLFDAAWRTLPPDKRERINRIWAILLMGQHCQQESCAMCFGTNAERKDCKFRRGMVELSLPDLRKLEKQSGK